MIKFNLLAVFVICFLACSNQASEKRTQTNNVDTSSTDSSQSVYSKDDTIPDTYHYDTALKSGYSLFFMVDDSTQYLYLKKGNIIKQLSSCSRGLPSKNLGYKAADFLAYFVLAYSFGSGNPHYIELIKKSNGENILKRGSAWIGADEEKGLLLYCETDIPSKKDKMILYDVNKNYKEYFMFPLKIFDEPTALNRIRIDAITDEHLIIEYETKNGLIKETYNRNK